MAATAAPTATPEGKNNECECRRWEIITREYEANGQPEIDTEGTGCASDTRKIFAPGHDAKLKSLLIKAGVESLEVRMVDGGMAITTDALAAARRYGFGHQVTAGIARARAKADAKAQRDAGKAKRAQERKDAHGDKAVKKATAAAKAKIAPPREVPVKIVPAAQPITTVTEKVDPARAELAALVGADTVETTPATVRIKVGRWEYDATIKDGVATYTDKQGEVQTRTDGFRVLTSA